MSHSLTVNIVKNEKKKTKNKKNHGNVQTKHNSYVSDETLLLKKNQRNSR